MKKEDKVISLELAEKIHAEHERLGIVVKSAWWWIRDHAYSKDDGLHLGFSEPYLCNDALVHNNETDRIARAYDGAELGEMLPKKIYYKTHLSFREGNMSNFVLYSYFDAGFFCQYLDVGTYANPKYQVLDKDGKGINTACTWGDTEAEARGKMYFWLLQNGYIKGD